MATASTDKKKWTSEAGPRQTKLVNSAMSAFSRESQTYTEVTDHGSHDLWSPLGGARSDAATYALAIGDQFDWTITRDNFKLVIAAYEVATADMAKSRPVNDKRTTPEERAERDRKNAEYKAKQDAAAAVKATDKARHLAELKAKYPWAKPDDKSTSIQARAAANLRTELAQAFPGHRFSVKSSSASMTNSVDVSWTNGPTTAEVKAIAGKYQYGSFDGMTDSYNHNNSAFSDAVGIVLGQSRWVQCHRDITMTDMETVGRALCEAQGVVYKQDARNVYGSGDTRWLSDHVHTMLAECSLPPGAVITGVEHNESGNPPYRITFDAPATGTVTSDAPLAGNGYTIEKRYHTKKNVDFWIVVLATKSDDATYRARLSTCKRAGGWYSRAWSGESGGFAFDNQESAAQWAAIEIGGDRAK